MNNTPANPTRPPANSSAPARNACMAGGGEVGREPNRLHALAFLKVGVFEIGFVIIVLLLLFGILNYFNILSVSDVLPKQLGWLPRKEVPNGTSQAKLASQGETLQSYQSKISPTP